MYTYAALLHLRLWRQRQRERRAEPPPHILGLALLTDARPDWRPGAYEARAFDRGVRYDYWVVKLLDWRGREEALASSGNPFALAVQTWLGVLAARGRIDSLAEVMRAMLRHLRRGGFSGAHVAALFAFLEQVTALPEDLQGRIEAEIASEEGGTVTSVMSRVERQGFQKGRQEGRQEALQEVVLLLLASRFGTLDEERTARVVALDAEQLKALYSAALAFSDRTELDTWLVAVSSTD